MPRGHFAKNKIELRIWSEVQTQKHTQKQRCLQGHTDAHGHTPSTHTQNYIKLQSYKNFKGTFCTKKYQVLLNARKLFVTQKMIRNLQCCFLGHKQFPGNQHKSQVKGGGQGGRGQGGGEGAGMEGREGGGREGGSSDCQGMWSLIRHFSHLFKAKQNFLI